MSQTPSEEIAARRAKYATRQYDTDTSGRVIGVGQLTPSQQMMIQELTPHLDGTVSSVDDDPDSETYGKVYEIPKRTPAILAASVREINGQPISFPKNRAELMSILDRLDTEGLTAAGSALGKFNPPKEKEEDANAEQGKDEVKN